jgi:hypothetical protein
MKKTILFLATLCISATAAINSTNAQTVKSNSEIADSKSLEISFAFGEATMINSSSENLNAINTKAVRNFDKNYKTVINENWYEVSNGYLAKFTSNGNDNMAAYDRKGHWQFTISYYDEKKLPAEVRATVKSTYYDYSITRVEEIHIDDKIIYLVHMQDDNTWKNVRICNGEMEVAEDFNKN